MLRVYKEKKYIDFSCKGNVRDVERILNNLSVHAYKKRNLYEI